MKRTLILALVALAGLVAALLLPKALGPAPQPPAVHAPVPPPVASGAGSLTLTVRPARTAFLANGDDLDVVVELRAAAAPDGRRAPVDLALVLDRSGSMAGEPLRKAREAAKALVSRLGEGDRLSLVHFGSEARLALELTAMHADGRARALEAVDGIADEGGTNMSEALLTAERTLLARPREGAIRRIVLLSDGQANEGILGPALVALADRFSRAGLRLSALGLGIDFDEETMLALADHGGGQYRYLRDADELSAALTRELAQASATAASGVRLVLVPEGGAQVLDVISYRPERDGTAVHVGVSDIAAGETRRVVLRVRAAGGPAGLRNLLSARVSYLDVLAGGREAAAQALARAEATTDAGRIAGSYDREAAGIGLRARLGGGVLGALRRYQADDVAGATASLDAALDGIRAEAAAMGDVGLVREMEQKAADATSRMRAAPAPGAAKAGVSKSLHSFGVDSAR